MTWFSFIFPNTGLTVSIPFPALLLPQPSLVLLIVISSTEIVLGQLKQITDGDLCGSKSLKQQQTHRDTRLRLHMPAHPRLVLRRCRHAARHRAEADSLAAEARRPRRGGLEE